MHNTRRAVTLLAITLVLASSLASCRNGKGDTVSTQPAPGTVIVNGTAVEPSAGDPGATVSPETAPAAPAAEEPVPGTWAATSETVITLGDSITITGEGAFAEGSSVTIAAAGTYLLSGVLEDGQLIVDTSDEEKVTLILNGVGLHCTDGSALLIRSAPKKVVLRTVEGSVNILSDGSGYVIPAEEQVEGMIYPNACIYSCEDLELEGTGELHVRGNADKGINTKDDLRIMGGIVTVTSVGAGIRGNDSVTVRGGTIHVSAGGDGIKSANTETEGKGYLTVEGGSLFITAKGDGLSAATDLTVSGGTLVLTTTDTDGVALEESSGNPTGSSGGGFGGGFGGMMGGSTVDKAAISAKGLKAAGTLTVSGGEITVVSQDDGLHSDGSLTITDGTLHIRAADDGIHAEEDLTISGGALTVAQSYEGLEALRIHVLGGTNRITASDDGANATGGTGGTGGGGFPGGGFHGGGRPRSGDSSTAAEVPDGTPTLTFAGGYSVFDAGGDGIDSNGSIVMTGGTVLVYGPTDNGNGAIDVGDGGYSMTVSGGTLLAVGSSGMAEAAENAGQAVLAASWRGMGLSAGETVGILDSDGRVLAAFSLPKAISSLVFSSPELVSGASYSIVGGGTAEGTVTDGVIQPAAYTGYEAIGEIQAY